LHSLRVFSFVQILAHLWHLGYSPEDIIGNIFRVCKTFQMAEYLKLEFIKVSESRAMPLSPGMWATLRLFHSQARRLEDAQSMAGCPGG